MSVKLKVKRGLSTSLPAQDDGSLIFTTDTKKMYLDSATDRIEIGENKLDKYTSTSYTGQSVYAISSDGSTVTQKMINTDGMSNTIDGTIPLRITNGNIPVPETPTNNTDAASKKYVDDSGKPFVVTVTYGNDNTYIADKTYAEIVEAYATGEQINAKIVNFPGVVVPSILPLYVKNSDDNVFMFSGSGCINNGILVMTATNTNGSWSVNITEAAQHDEVSTALENKLDKITPTTDNTYLYSVSKLADEVIQGSMQLNDGTPKTGTIPQYVTNGVLRANTPAVDLDVANKKYVDDAVAGAGGGSLLRTATYIIASSDSLDDAKNAADLVIQTTEDTAAKLAAITFTVDGPNPGTYYFAPGTYNVTSNTQVNCPGTYSFIGYGANIEIINGGAFTFGDTTSSITTSINLEGFNFTQSSISPASGLALDVSLLGTTNVNKCQFTGSLPAGGLIAYTKGGLNVTDCYFNTSQGIVINTGNTATAGQNIYRNTVISNCIFKDYTTAIGFSGKLSAGYTIVNNFFDGGSSSSYAIYLESNVSSADGLNISNNNNEIGKFIWSSTSTTRTFENLHICNNTSSPNASVYDVCLYGVFTNTVISDNDCKYGIKLWTRGSTSTNLTVKGNVVSALSMHAGLDDYTTGSFSKVVITGNLITGQYYSNIGGSRWALNKGSIIDGNSIYRYHSSAGSYDDQFFVSGNGSEEWASTSQVMFGNNIDNA